MFPHGKREPPAFQFITIASYPGTGHNQEEPGSIFFALSLQTFTPVRFFHELPLLQTVPISLSLSSWKICFRHFIFFPVLGTHYWTPRFRCVSSVLSREAGSIPLTCWRHQRVLVTLCCLTFSFMFTRTCCSYSARLLSRWTLSSIYACAGCSSPDAGFALILTETKEVPAWLFLQPAGI